jgi:hypothetical protein
MFLKSTPTNGLTQLESAPERANERLERLLRSNTSPIAARRDETALAKSLSGRVPKIRYSS